MRNEESVVIPHSSYFILHSLFHQLPYDGSYRVGAGRTGSFVHLLQHRRQLIHHDIDVTPTNEGVMDGAVGID